MSIEDSIKKYLRLNGMSQKQAQAVVDGMKANDSIGMSQRWADSADDYPSVVLESLYLMADSMALEWIDANVPEA